MRVIAATKKEVLMDFDIGAPGNKIATCVARYDFTEGVLRYEIYPIIGLSYPKILLTQPIINHSEKMSLAKAMIVINNMEHTVDSSVTPDIGYRIHVNDSTYLWDIDNDIIRFIKVPDESDDIQDLFKVFLNKATETILKAIMLMGPYMKEKDIPYRIIYR